MKLYKALAELAKGKEIRGPAFRDGSDISSDMPGTALIFYATIFATPEMLNEEGWEVVEENDPDEKPNPRRSNEHWKCAQCVYALHRNVSLACPAGDPVCDETNNYHKFKPVEPKPKTEIWPVKPAPLSPPLSADLCFRDANEGGKWFLLSSIMGDPCWTGRYEFTLPSGKKLLCAFPRIMVGENDQWRPPEWFDKFDYGNRKLATPTGVEVLAQG